jgi:hypothetical protein
VTTEQVWTGAAAVLGLLILAVLATLTLALLALRRARRAESLLAALAVRVGALESPVAAASRPVVDEEPVGTYVITGMQSAAQEPATLPATLPVAQPIDGRLFADIVARESVVKAASWTHGLRRALSAESRNRIRFEVRRETRRATRERRAETKQALREFRARERALRVEPAGEDVA